MSTPATIEDCIRAGDILAREIELATGFDITDAYQASPPRFLDFELTPDIKKGLLLGPKLMRENHLDECLRVFRATTTNLLNMQIASMRGEVSESLLDFTYELTAVKFVAEEMVTPVRLTIKQFDDLCAEDSADLDLASVYYWQIVTLCEQLKREKQAEEEAARGRNLRERELRRAEEEQRVATYFANLSAAADALDIRFASLTLAA